MKVMAPLPFDIRLMNKVATWLLTLCVLVCLASGLWWGLRHPSFALQLITVEGEVSRNNALTLKTNVVPQLNGNFFTLELDQARQAFESVPWVRSAVVHREFPNRLRVRLQEQHPVALWGEEGSSSLLNEQGQVFEANLGEVEADALPRLKGPASQSQQVLDMYQTLRPVLQGADMDMDELELSARGSWKLLTTQGAVIELGREVREAREAMQRLLALPDPPTAVVATNDVFAVGAMLACREAGVRVPEDISITGVDNTDLGATQTPGLTSVSTPIVEVGRAAADQIVARLEGQPCEAFQVFPADIVHRGTTAPPRRGPLRAGSGPLSPPRAARWRSRRRRPACSPPR